MTPDPWRSSSSNSDWETRSWCQHQEFARKEEPRKIIKKYSMTIIQPSIEPSWQDATISRRVGQLVGRMAAPSKGGRQRLKRPGDISKGVPRLQQRYEWQGKRTIVTTNSDVDWVGCREARKSTTGGCITIGHHIIKGWSDIQTFVALSSRESELYSTLEASAETLGRLATKKKISAAI